MTPNIDRVLQETRYSIAYATVPALASLLSVSKVARALAGDPGGGVTFPFPTGLPTLWTYVSLPGGPGGVSFGGPLSVVAFVPLFIVGLLLTSALEAGFLGTLYGRIQGTDPDFLESIQAFLLRMVGVNLVRAAAVFVALPFLVFPPAAFAVVIVLMYLIYGLPFEIVVRDIDVVMAIEATVSKALDGGPYARFGLYHLVGGAVGSVVLTVLVRNFGMFGILAGTALVAVPALFVAIYGLFVFRDLRTGRARDPDRSALD